MQVVHVEARAGGEEGGRVDKRSTTHCVAVEWFGWTATADASRFFKTEFRYCCNVTEEGPASNVDEQQPLAEIIATNPENLTNYFDAATVFPETSDTNGNARSLC